AIYLGLILLWVIIWLYLKYSLPNTTENHIGIVLCIVTEHDKEKIRLKKDFLSRLTALINDNQLQDIVKVILLKNHQAERLIPFLDLYTGHLSAPNKLVSRKQLKQLKRWE